MKNHIFINCLFFIITLFLTSSCTETVDKKVQDDKKERKTSIIVTATAYNSLASQTTTRNNDVAAWGDTLVPGDCAIAVSRDLIKRGLNHNTEIEIEGLSGTYIVKDKMNKRWKNKIDIYMGLNKKAAREWGKKKVEISFKED